MELLYLYTYMKNHICRWIYYLNNPNPNASIPGTNPPPHSRPTWASSLEVDHNNLSRVPSRPTPPCGGPDIGRSGWIRRIGNSPSFHRAPGWNIFCWTPLAPGLGVFWRFLAFFFTLLEHMLGIHSLLTVKNKNKRHTIIQTNHSCQISSECPTLCPFHFIPEPFLFPKPTNTRNFAPKIRDFTREAMWGSPANRQLTSSPDTSHNDCIVLRSLLRPGRRYAGIPGMSGSHNDGMFNKKKR